MLGLGWDSFFDDLQGVGVDLHFLDVVDWWHVLLFVLLVLLLLPEHPELEELEPAFVSKLLSAKLDHFAVDHVVRWDVSDKLAVARFKVSDHQQIRVDSLVHLLQCQVAVLQRWLVVEARSVPVAPGFRLSFGNEVPEVFVEAIAHEFEQGELSGCLLIRFNRDSLGTVNHVFSHAHLQTVLDDVVVEAPSVEVNLPV